MAIHLLRVTPLILTTSSLTFSFNQYQFFQPCLYLPDTLEDRHVNDVLRVYIKRQFPSGLATILTLYPLTWATAAANLSLRTYAGVPRKLHVAGLMLSAAHMFWAPRAKALMEEIGEECTTGDKDRIGMLRTWLRLHVARSLLADLPSWICFAGAFLLSKRARM
ncbi:hypothetical protein QBC47DRAFT_354863 [Echria macrotheca]|uniref:Integral membrane protein n=1 Tax=Echria macrotheca TaxID=438768 RepID=A0AAJ0B1N8_9PEZI|nr:hypothetical protein QBC47DRAFT_354863 [Echria macrotheca]